MTNPLVAKPKETTTGVTGIGIAESAVDLANGVKDGSWVEAGLGGIGVGLEVLSMVIDPVGTVLQYGVSWLIEHVEPLKEALDWFAGDPPVIQSFSDTWANVSTEVKAIAQDYLNDVQSGTSGWSGEAADAYRQATAEQADAVEGAATLADGISGGVMVMGMVVAAVREIVRDLVAELVAKLITWALEAVATLGFGTPVIAAQATAAIAKVTNRISDLVRKLIKTIGNVTPRLRKIVDKLGEIIEKLAKLGRKADAPSTPSASTVPSGVKSPDAPTVKSPDGPTTPSGTTSPDAPSNGSGSPTTGTGSKGAGDTPGSAPSRPADPQAAKTPPQRRYCKDDPVDVVSGEVILTQTDLALPGALPLIVQRTHVSSYRAGRLFGPNWSSTLDQRLEFDEEGVVYVSDDGMLLIYPAPQVDGPAVLPEFGPSWPLTRTEQGYQLSRPTEGRQLEFSEKGTLLGISDRNDNRIDLRYGADRAHIEMTHSGGYRCAVQVEDGRATGMRLAGSDGAEVEIVSYAYDEQGRLGTIVNSSGRGLELSYDEVGRLSRWRDRNGRWYGYHYDELGRCVRNDGADGFLNGQFEYDDENLVTSFVDSLGHQTSYTYDANRNVVKFVDPLGAVTRQEWDTRDRLVAKTDPLGRVTRFRYDDDGNLVEATRPDGTMAMAEYNRWGQPVLQIDPGGAIWRQEYDERGNLLAVTDPVGAVTRYLRDDRGNLVGKTDPLGNTVRIEVNAAGLPIAVTNAMGTTTRYTRDLFGRVTRVVDAGGNVSTATWTVEGKLLSRTNPDGTTERWRYDGEGATIEHVNVLGQSTRFETTHFDLIAARIDCTGERTEFSYDADLRLVAVRNPAGQVWSYHHDAAGNLVGEVDYNGREVRYEPDAAGRLVRVTNGAGEVVAFVRDDLGRVVARQTETTMATYEFSESGALVRAVNEHAEVVMARDAAGRITAETVNGLTMSYRYDAAGRLVGRRTPTGVESTWQYDAAGRCNRLGIEGRSISFGYDDLGREVERLFDSGTIMTHDWDGNYRLTAQTISAVQQMDPARQARMLQRRRFSYRADNFVTSVEDALAGTRHFELDAFGRVTAAHGVGAHEQISYDRSGNVSGTTTQRAGARTTTQGSADVRYQYDRQGRVVMKSRKRLSRKPDVWHYAWDAEDRLVSVRTPDGVNWRYLYDPLGRRIAKQRLNADGSVADQVRFTWDGVTLAEQVGPQGHAITWNIDEKFRPLAQFERGASGPTTQEAVDERFFAIVTDLVGTPTELVDDRGGLAWRADNTVWGRALARLQQTASTPLRFPGQYYDDETGLHYNFFRYYDPDTGRYASSDPLGLRGSNNPHAYVANPMRSIDPLGLMTCDEAEKVLRDLDPNDPANLDKRSEAWNKLYEDAENNPARQAEALQREREGLARQVGNDIARDRGNVPRDLRGGRLDAPQAHVPGSQYHVQGPGTGSPGLNLDGTFHDGDPGWGRRTYEYLHEHGFAWPLEGPMAGQGPTGGRW